MILKKLIIDIIHYIKENFSFRLYLSVGIIAGLLIFVEYKWHVYDHISIKYGFDNIIYLINLILFSFTYYIVVFVIKLLDKSLIKLNSEFWLKSFAGLLVLSVYISYFGHYGIKTHLSYPSVYYYLYTSENLSGLITLMLPLYLIYRIFDKNQDIPFYGLSFKNFDFKLALILSAISVFVSFAGSKFGDVSEYYPILNRTAYKSFSATVGIKPVISAVFFESAYLFDFVMIELFFRGFMIFGFVKLLGKNAILPVAVLYAVIHFGKPLPETISSFFGAYFLGIIAYSQKNIGIGIVLHCVLALAMEIFTIF